MRRTVVLNVVGLTPQLLAHAPHLRGWAEGGAWRPVRPVIPAVTTTVQATYLTGLLPEGHGIVANGWYDRDLAEVMFWRQSRHLVQGNVLWQEARQRDGTFRCAQLFWWFNMYCGADIALTPRPIYRADGRKLPDIYTEPPELRHQLQAQLGPFPLFSFWGPKADITSSRWITEAALNVLRHDPPTLTLVYLLHLDYPLQRLGPSHPSVASEVASVDALCASLLDAAEEADARVVVLSEYGISEVQHPVHLNRLLRSAGFLRVREELGGEQLDAGASRAFAVADHQIAHVYVREASDLESVRSLIEAQPGVDMVLDSIQQQQQHLWHYRSGDLLAIASADSWFTYYHFL